MLGIGRGLGGRLGFLSGNVLGRLSSTLAVSKSRFPAVGRRAVLSALSRQARPPAASRSIELWPMLRRPFSDAASLSGLISSKAVGKGNAITVPKAVPYWLFGCCGMVFGMVVLGGVTRLTRSGLSMVHWRPLGGLPPMNDQEWSAEFERYQTFPEYEAVHKGMTVGEFKRIYFMEWSHRMFGRALGVAFALPMAYFGMRGYLTRPLLRRLTVLLGMGASQGAIGWWMVKSGLETKEHDYELPRVNPYRLATHLMSAFAIYGFMLHTALQLWSPALPASVVSKIPASFKKTAHGTAMLIGLTAFSGAFVAGNEAGLVYNEFPKMGGRWIPEDIVNPYLPSVWQNIFENSSLVQFEHRALAMMTLASVGSLWGMSRFMAPSLPPQAITACNALLGVASAQVVLGIATLLTFVPTELAACHQAGSLTLFSVAFWVLHALRRV